MGKKGSKYRNSPYLYKAIVKYGAQNFKYEILVKCYDQETADYLEEYYIKQYRSQDSHIGYNLKEGGRGGKHSLETKEKISQSVKKQLANLTPEELLERTAKISSYWSGKQRGPQTEQWKQENSAKIKAWHAEHPHPMLGKSHSAEAKAKIKRSSLGRKCSPEAIQKRVAKLKIDQELELSIIMAYQSGDLISEIEKEYGVRVSTIYRVLKRNAIPLRGCDQSWVGKSHTPETLEKMSRARKKYWERQRVMGTINQE
jgi:group I intron endonuclease